MTFRSALYAALVLLFLLRNDLWWWDDPTIVAGMPIGLTYHAAYCGLVAGAFGLLVRYAWPANLDRERP